MKRSSPEMTQSIMESLEWLGLEHDDEPVKQSERFPVYRKHAESLLESKKAYPCFCTPLELEQRRREAADTKGVRKYDRKCLNLSDEEKQEVSKRSAATRFFIPEGNHSFVDGMRGKLERNSEEIEDFVLMKSDGSSAYNLACVVDDHDLGVTHVIRGEDHIVNTFKQSLLYKALGWETPKFIHLPMILGPDRSKLSKRHGAVSVLEYKKEGILPGTLVNYLALLGWSPGDDREFLSLSELIDLFSIERLSPTASVFDAKKLDWMNGEYIRRFSDEELLEKLSTLDSRLSTLEQDYMLQVVSALKPRMQKLTDFEDLSSYFFEDPKEYDSKGIEKQFGIPGACERLSRMRDNFAGTKSFDVEGIETIIRDLASELDIKAAMLIHPLRLALSGRTGGPSMFHLVEILGKDTVLRRLEKAIEFVERQ
jgi:glutamyl-tRNA synthetase